MNRSCLVPPALAIFLGACAQQGSAPSAAARPTGGNCFLASQVNGYGWVQGGQAIDVRVGADRYYRLGLGAGCPFGKFATGLALKSRSGSSWICEPLDAELIIPDPSGTETCSVMNIRPLTKAEWVATKHT